VTARRVATVQAAPLLFDLPETLRRFTTLLGRAASQGAELVAFPEAFIGGYPKGVTFGATVGQRHAAGRALFARYRASAIEVPGEVADEIGATVAAHRTQVVVGVIERRAGTLYCSSLLFGSDGTLLGHHRKLVPTGTERLIWGSGDAGDVFVEPVRGREPVTQRREAAPCATTSAAANDDSYSVSSCQYPPCTKTSSGAPFRAEGKKCNRSGSPGP